MKTWDLDSGETLYEDGYMKTTATPAVHAVEPLKPSLPDPPFTIAQIIANFSLMQHTHNIEWCHNLARDVMERGIVEHYTWNKDDTCKPCTQHYCCPLNEITKERDTLQKIAANACLKFIGIQITADELRIALQDLVRTTDTTKRNEHAMQQARRALGLKPHAPKMM